MRVQPGARRTAVVGEHGGRLKIAVRAPPVDGRANEALIEWLAERLGVPRQGLRIVSGERGRDKIVSADGVSLERARQLLAPE